MKPFTTIRFFYDPTNVAAGFYTSRITTPQAKEHIASGSDLADEASLLLEFSELSNAMQEHPKSFDLGGATYTLHAEQPNPDAIYWIEYRKHARSPDTTELKP